jgi:peptidoglycan hydrolase-like protein with peptidoglycan-binding domain
MNNAVHEPDKDKKAVPSFFYMRPREDLTWNDNPPFPLEMSEGSEGPNVKKLQEYLQARGLYDGPIDGHFDKVTEKAVQSFQLSKDLPPHGKVDLKTWASIFSNAL